MKYSAADANFPERDSLSGAHLLNRESQRWLKRFIRAQGRRPRLLHIGNIANNAYLNAKMLNRAGIDSDVLCYNYYHIMGSPEWEDADFDGEIADPNFPNWKQVDLRGFERPSWFAQGPMMEAVQYLKALRDGDGAAACRSWKAMGWTPGASPQPRDPRLLERIVQWLRRWPRAVVRTLGSASGAGAPGESSPTSLRDLAFAAAHERRLADLCAQFRLLFPERPDAMVPADLAGYAELKSDFPDLQKLLRRYDAIVGYATDGIYPLLLSDKPYLAFEHGTIRGIPFEQNSRGRLCALTYRLADATLITNCDNHLAAQKLGLQQYRFMPHPINEDFPDVRGCERLRASLQKQLDSSFLVFHPARQHWEERRHPDWEKGNDIFVRGFARFVREVRPDAAAVFVDWGQTVQATRNLLTELGIDRRILWIDPVPNQQMLRYIKACDVLADQFYLGAFGSTMPKALMLGVPAMLYVNEDVHRWCFPELPPILNARTPEQVFEGLRSLVADPARAEELRRRSIAWYRSYHSNAVILNAWVDTLAGCLELSQRLAS